MNIKLITAAFAAASLLTATGYASAQSAIANGYAAVAFTPATLEALSQQHVPPNAVRAQVRQNSEKTAIPLFGPLAFRR